MCTILRTISLLLVGANPGQKISIEFHLRNALTFENNLSESLSLLEDVDLAEEMMNFISLDIRQYGDQLLISQVNQRNHGALNIL